MEYVLTSGGVRFVLTGPNAHLVSRPPFAGMYWTAAQQLASNGASLRRGDLFTTVSA